MKVITLTGIMIGALWFVPSQVIAKDLQTATKPHADKLISTLQDAQPNKPDDFTQSLVKEISSICYSRECNSGDVDFMVSTVINAIGKDNPLISDFLHALNLYGTDFDTITLSAITYGVDATVASEATAAGGTPTLLIPDFSLPNRTTPNGSGGSGGDSGISESGI
ncbi:hypothetical protein NQT69_00410 [Pseudoalteromonas shioyasakiensis]|uniref:hypothetical protein n=1 Tax=Pseudoalteromonas shioyasakiensis TaxID=1190813 RepID=UPI0021182725|nr:hypothetical protein [Pseudoalteromonas shioyasakiensis]MCQ8876502.1 hypothetical protein [Pseudoalteromonas shioyasakiensis]